MFARRVIGAMGALVCTVASSAAFGQNDDAQELVRQGVALRRAHQNQPALEAFQQAMKLSPTPSTRAQLGLAEQALGRWLEAARELDAALAETGDPWIAKNLATLAEARAVVGEHLAYLTVDVSVPTAQIALGGESILPGTEACVLAGAGTLVTRAPDYAPDVHDIELAPKEHAHLTIALVRFAPPPAPVAAIISASGAPPAPETTRAPVAHATSAVGPIVLGALGVAGLGTMPFT